MSVSKRDVEGVEIGVGLVVVVREHRILLFGGDWCYEVARRDRDLVLFLVCLCCRFVEVELM